MICYVAFSFTETMLTNEKLDYLEQMAKRGLVVLKGHYTMSAILELIEEVRRLQTQLNQFTRLPPKLLPPAECKSLSDDAEFPP